MKNKIFQLIIRAVNVNGISPNAYFRMNWIQKVGEYISPFWVYGIPALIICFASGFFISKSWLDAQLHTPAGIEGMKFNAAFKAHTAVTMLTV